MKILYTQKNPARKSGFSLLEVTISMSIFLAIMVLGGNFIITGFRSTTFGAEQATAIASARRAMEIMTKEIRGINTSDRGDYPLANVQADNFCFYSDINYDGSMEKIQYYLDNLLLKKTVTLSGPDNEYSAPGATTTIADYVNNQTEPIFTYYDSNRAETADIDEIRLISISLKMNVTPTISPNDYYVETDISLRNLKDNL